MTYNFSHRAETERELESRKRELERKQENRMGLFEALGIELVLVRKEEKQELQRSIERKR